MMELAKITSKGQITLPVSIRRALKLKDGDKVAFIEKNGQYVLVNPLLLAIREVQDSYSGEADRLGLNDIDDIVNMVKEIRESKKK
jgi:AbrB family looped-hinge helix DNA binding protein